MIIVLPEELNQWKIPVTPATYRFVAQRLNQLQYRVPQLSPFMEDDIE